MKYVPHIVGGLLGALFIAGSVFFFISGGKPPEPPAGTPPPPKEVLDFMSAMMPTGYMHMVKVFELLGGLLVAIPKTRNYGLLILGPIIINILAFHQFVAKDLVKEPVVLVIAAVALYLLWVGRRNFAGLKN